MSPSGKSHPPISDGRNGTAVHVFYPGGEALADTLRRCSTRQVVLLESKEEFRLAASQLYALLVLRPPRGMWQQCTELRMIQTVGVGVDSVLPALDLPERVALTNARGMAAEPIAEFGLAALLSLIKRTHLAVERQSRQTWRRWMPAQLSGSTVGLIGLGAIGCALARRLEALGATVLGCRRSPGAPPTGVSEVHPPEGLAAMLSRCDSAVVLVPSTPETRHLLSTAELDQLRPGSQLVDLSRGGVVDEAALLQRLQRGDLHCWRDVFEQEPLPRDHPLWRAPNLIVTPHLAGSYARYYDDLAQLFLDNVARLERGQPLRNEIDRTRGY